MDTIRTLCCKLQLDPPAIAALRATRTTFNAAASWIATIAWDDDIRDKRVLHDRVYYPTRATFGLGAQLTCCARDKALEAIKAADQHGDDATCPVFRPTSSIRYDARTYSFLSNDHVSLNTTTGRVKGTLILGTFQRQRLDDPAWTTGGAELVERRGTWYLHLTQTRPAPPLYPTDGAIGCDLGIVNLCTTDDGTNFSGTQVQQVRERRFRHRQRLEKKGTRNAKRRIRRSGKKESRFQKAINHHISKALVQKAVAEQKALRMEDLTHIRRDTAATVPRSQRRQRASWAFRQLRAFVTYKAQQAGVEVILVEPRHTSRRCFVCGYTAKANRPNQATFRCQVCNHTAAADVNAAKNIAFWAAVSQPIASPRRR
jgi:putative transposase